MDEMVKIVGDPRRDRSVAGPGVWLGSGWRLGGRVQTWVPVMAATGEGVWLAKGTYLVGLNGNKMRCGP